MIGFPSLGWLTLEVWMYVSECAGCLQYIAAAIATPLATDQLRAHCVLQASFTPMVWTLQPMRMQDLLLEVRELTPREPNQSMDGGHTIG